MSSTESSANDGESKESANHSLDDVNNTSSKKRMADGKQTREEKRRKFEAKQAFKAKQSDKEKERVNWIQKHSNFASLLTEKEVTGINSKTSTTDDSNDVTTFLAPYLDIQENSTKNATDASGRRLFIAEGTETIRILVQQSHSPRCDGLTPIGVNSIFLKPSLFFDPPVHLLGDIEKAMAGKQENLQGDVRTPSPGFKVLIAAESVLSRVAGFPVSRGVLACGVVPDDRNEEWLRGFLKTRWQESKRIRLLALDGICDTSNLGSMIRCSSAFGVDAVILSKDACDCWYRRAIRVSMGHVFRVPIVRVQDLASELSKWSSDKYGFKSYAAVLDTSSLLAHLKPGEVPRSWCCVMGNEGGGISPGVAAACSEKIRIDMVGGVDSLSVPIACGILLHGLRERES
jgi:tRNA G18 (ribose-2'-O)-methylase SpoU